MSRTHLRLVREDEDTPDTRVDAMLDLQGVPAAERWPRISDAVRRLASERGGRWRLKLLLTDGPEEASEMPALMARLGQAGLRFNTVREPGGIQGTLLVPDLARDALPAAA